MRSCCCACLCFIFRMETQRQHRHNTNVWNSLNTVTVPASRKKHFNNAEQMRRGCINECCSGMHLALALLSFYRLLCSNTRAAWNMSMRLLYSPHTVFYNSHIPFLPLRLNSSLQAIQRHTIESRIPSGVTKSAGRRHAPHAALHLSASWKHLMESI